MQSRLQEAVVGKAGIAGIGDEHLDLLSKLCTLLEDPALLETLKTTDDDVKWVLEQLS